MVSKYKAEKCVIDGIKFDSKLEGKYYELLKSQKAHGIIINFELQPRFILQPNFKLDGKNYRKIEYVSDFRIYELDGTETIVDIKGMATPEAKMKRKMFIYQYTDIKLLWLVWNKKQWRNFDDVAKDRLKRKAIKKFEDEKWVEENVIK